MLTTTRYVTEIKQGLLDRSMFSSQEIYEQELEQIFARCWLCVGHESQIPSQNDFITSYMGEDPVIVWRDGNGKIHAFLNMCRHRGNRLCSAEKGNASTFMCTYHGWNYKSDGRLSHVPGINEVYGEDFDKSKWGLVEVAQLDIYKGLIFATFDPTAPPLPDYLGEQKPLLDFMLDRRAGGTEIIGIHKWVLKTNWKFPVDNFGGDDGHHAITHASIRKVPVDAVDYSVTVTDQYKRMLPNMSSEEVEKLEESLASKPRGLLRDYYREHFPEALQRLGRNAYRQFIVELVFPNFSLNTHRHMIRVWHPRGPMATEMWSYCLVDKDAPQEVKDALRHHLTQTFGPSGNFEQDDINMWQHCTSTARGWVARRYPQNIQAGMTDSPDADLGRQLGARLRGIYTRWAMMMKSKSWDEINLKSQDWT